MNEIASYGIRRSEGSLYHIYNGESGNRKFIHPKGYETVLDVNGNIVRSPSNRSTFNFGADCDSIRHVILSVLPYYILGNSPDEPTPFRDGFCGGERSCWGC